MTVIAINAQPHCAPPDLTAIARVAQTAPIVILVHGFKYDPAVPAHSPHRKVFHPDPDGWHHRSWPAPLGVGRAGGLTIAFGWPARGRFTEVAERARSMGLVLARLIRTLHHSAPERPVSLIAHSLGSEVVLAALPALGPASVKRIVLLSGASLTQTATKALDSDAGQRAELFNIVSRENDVFDAAIEWLYGRKGPMLGDGIWHPNALNIQLDCPVTLQRLERFGASIAPPDRRVCHWSTYNRPGALEFYGKLLTAPSRTPLAQLRSALPQTLAPRWSRLKPRGLIAHPLPPAANAAP